VEDGPNSQCTVDIEVAGRIGIVLTTVRVLIDGECAGVLGVKRTGSFPVAAGAHKAMLKCQFLRSETVNLCLSAGERAALGWGCDLLRSARSHLVTVAVTIALIVPIVLRLPHWPFYTAAAVAVVAIGVSFLRTYITPGGYLYLRRQEPLLVAGARAPRVMQLPRMTIRQWMMAVAVLALILGLGVVEERLHRRIQNARVKATIYATRADFCRAGFPLWAKAAQDHGDRENESKWQLVEYFEARAEAEARRAEYYDALSRKYRAAARYPWHPVAPDPPEPKDPPVPEWAKP